MQSQRSGAAGEEVGAAAFQFSRAAPGEHETERRVALDKKVDLVEKSGNLLYLVTMVPTFIRFGPLPSLLRS